MKTQETVPVIFFLLQSGTGERSGASRMEAGVQVLKNVLLRPSKKRIPSFDSRKAGDEADGWRRAPRRRPLRAPPQEPTPRSEETGEVTGRQGSTGPARQRFHTELHTARMPWAAWCLSALVSVATRWFLLLHSLGWISARAFA